MNLQKQKQQLEDRLKEILIEQSNLDKIQDRDIKVFVIDLLKSRNIIQEGDVVDAYRTRIDVKRSHPDYSYDKDMFTIYHDTVSWKEDSEYKTEINYYTGGSTNDKWELNRLVSLGRMAEFLVVESNYNKITDGIAKIKSIHGPIAKQFYKERFEIEKQLREIELEERRQKKEQFIQDLKKGVEFENVVSFGNTSQTFHSVRSLQIKDLTPSGKSADLKLKWENWDNSVSEYETRMKVDAIEDLYTESYTVS